MPRFVRLRTSRTAAVVIVGSVVLSAGIPIPAAAETPTIYTIGVDNAGPVGHVFEYVDYFPRQAVSVSANDVLDFSWNTGSVDGAHTVSFLPKGIAPPPLGVPEAQADEPGLEFNPDIVFPSDPTCGETKANPCVFDGSSVVSSGFIANGNPTPPYFTDFFVKLDPKLLNGGRSVDVPYVCEIHPGMVGSVTLVGDGRDVTPVATVQSNAAKQFDDDTTGALLAEKSDSGPPLVQRRPNGTANVTAIAGTATPYVEVVEMLPFTLTINAGDTVTWVTKTMRDPHTVTFPRGPGSESVDPLPPNCEGPQGDTPPSAEGPPCANPADFELHLVPQPLGSSAITSPTTVATSGILANYPPFPNSFSYTFPNAGSFDYMCRVHDHMVGLVVVR